MTCKEILEQLQDYLDGDLKEKYSCQVEDHLESCLSCREEYQALKQISELFRKERIRLPNEEQWRETWKTIEVQIAAPKLSWYREIVVLLDTFAMRFFSPQSLTLRASFSLGLFVLGIVFGGMYLAPSGQIFQQVVKVEHQVKEVPVVEYMEKKIVQPQFREKVVEKPQQVVYLASTPVKLAPVFPASDPSELKADTPGLWNAKDNVDEQIQKIHQELAPTFNEYNNASPTIRQVSVSD